MIEISNLTDGSTGSRSRVRSAQAPLHMWVRLCTIGVAYLPGRRVAKSRSAARGHCAYMPHIAHGYPCQLRSVLSPVWSNQHEGKRLMAFHAHTGLAGIGEVCIVQDWHSAESGEDTIEGLKAELAVAGTTLTTQVQQLIAQGDSLAAAEAEVERLQEALEECEASRDAHSMAHTALQVRPTETLVCSDLTPVFSSWPHHCAGCTLRRTLQPCCAKAIE